jgi:geranylgeranyl diphosphate synthase, type II
MSMLMNSSRLKSYLQEKKAEVDRTLDRLLPGENEEPRVIHQSMRYSVFAGGKRLRPILAISAYELAGRHDGGILPPACGLELIHTYSLIHDDLPCMDDDDLRRGQPTNHKVFGDAIAVLAGDALLPLAFECFLGRGMNGQLPLATLSQISKRVAHAIGTMGLVGGQVMDITRASSDRQLATLETTCLMKTGSLIQVSLECGALLAEANSKTTQALSDYGKALGLAFQITDDILNVVGDSQKMGKAIKTDASHQKVTFPELLGIEAARSQAREWNQRAKRAIRDFGEPAWVLRELADYVIERQS